MSGDIGRGATRASIAFALRLAAAQGRPNGLCGRAYLSMNVVICLFRQGFVQIISLTFQVFFNWRVALMLTQLTG